MDKETRKRLFEATERMHDVNDWTGVETLWQPYVLQEDPEAQFRLAYYYFFYSFDVQPERQSEMEKLLRSAAERNHPDAVYWLSHLSHVDAERDSLLLRAADLGSVDAQHDLGVRYATGDWTGPRDAARAVQWYRRAAERGHADAQYNLGFMYLLGDGIPADTAEGLQWLEQAGRQGERQSLKLLADLYRSGRYGIAINPREAARWDLLYQQARSANPSHSAETEPSKGGR